MASSHGFASRAFTAVMANASPCSSAASLSLASSSSSASASSLLGFAASGAAAVALLSSTSTSASSSSPSSSSTMAMMATAPFSSFFDAVLPVTHCLELVDPSNDKVYDVQIQTYGSLFSPGALVKRTGMHLGFAYSKAGTAFIEAGRGVGGGRMGRTRKKI